MRIREDKAQQRRIKCSIVNVKFRGKGRMFKSRLDKRMEECIKISLRSLRNVQE